MIPSPIINIYEEVLIFRLCRLYNSEEPNVIVLEITTKGFASDGEIHHIDLNKQICRECEQYDGDHAYICGVLQV